MTNRWEPPSAEALDRMSIADFVTVWCSIMGEPPAIMLENRCEMIRILIAATSPGPPHADEPSVTQHVTKKVF